MVRNKKQKREASAEETPIAPPSKSARVASPTGTGDDAEVDEPQLGNGVDPMEALEQSEDQEDDPMDALGREAGAEAAIKPRIADEFEQKAEREVEAAGGLGGDAAEEGKMKLVHQVRHQVSPDCPSDQAAR